MACDESCTYERWRGMDICVEHGEIREDGE